MNNFIDKLAEKLTPLAAKLGSNRYLTVLRDAFMLAFPLTMFGSIVVVLNNLPFFSDDLKGTLNGLFGNGQNATMSIMTLFIAFGIGYYLTKSYDEDGVFGGVVSLASFLILTPFNLTTADGVEVGGVLTSDRLGAKGMFIGMLAAFLAAEIYTRVKKKGIVIKMPEGVPPAVADSFASLLPLTFIVIIVWFVRVVLGVNINEVVRMVFSPLVVGLGTLPGVWITTFLVQFLWICGIHGGHTLAGLTSPIALQFLAENSAAFQNNAPIPHVNPEGFWVLFQSVGGTGATLGLVIAMLFSKSVLYKSLGKLSIGPALFCINEPVIFGFPIVMNPVMMIPFILTPLVLGTATYLLMDFGLIGKIVHNVPWTIPPIIGPYLATNGNIYAAIWSLVSIIISCVMYYPFFKIEEKKQLEVELNNATKA